MCICVSVSVCVCVCVSNTTKLQKNYMLKCPFLWLETGSFSETGKRLIVIVYECLRGPFMVLLRSPIDSRWRECVAAAKKFGKKRTRVFEDDVFIENTCLVGGSKTQDLNLRADLVLKHVTWSSWPIVSRDWISERPPYLWEQVAYRPK